MIKFIVPKGKVYNPMTGKSIPSLGDYIEFDQYWVRREREGLVDVLKKRPEPKVAATPLKEKPKSEGKTK